MSSTEAASAIDNFGYRFHSSNMKRHTTMSARNKIAWENRHLLDIGWVILVMHVQSCGQPPKFGWKWSAVLSNRQVWRTRLKDIGTLGQKDHILRVSRSLKDGLDSQQRQNLATVRSGRGVVWMATSATVSSENCNQAVSSVKIIVLPESFLEPRPCSVSEGEVSNEEEREHEGKGGRKVGWNRTGLEHLYGTGTVQETKKRYMIREIRRASPIWKASGLPRIPEDKRFAW